MCIIIDSNCFSKVFDTNNLTDLYKMISSTNTVFVEEMKFLKGWYVIKVTPNSKGDAIQMSNYFSESKLFEYSELDFGYYPVE